MTSCSWASYSRRLINDLLWHTNNQGGLGPFGLAVTDDNEADQRPQNPGNLYIFSI